MLKNKFFFIIFFYINNILFSNNPDIQISINSSEIFINEQTYINIFIDQKVDNIESPKSDSYKIDFSGENINSKVVVENGKLKTKLIFVYSFILKPLKKGKLKIDSFNIYIDNNKYQTETIFINVKSKSKEYKSKNYEDEIKNFEKIIKKEIPEIYFRLIPSKNIYYQNEQIILEGYIISVDKSVFDYKFIEVSPIFSGKFIIYDISKTIDNKLYFRNGYFIQTFKRYIMYSIEKGLNGIGSPEIVAVSPYGQIKLKTENIGIEITNINNSNTIHYLGDLFIKSKISTNFCYPDEIINIDIEKREVDFVINNE